MNDSLEKSPLYIKAQEIYELVAKVSLLIEDNNDKNDFDNRLINVYKNQLNESALLIPAKIAGVFNEETLYDLKMENAAIIRKEARTILVTTSGLKMLNFAALDYLELIRNEIEEFRILFAEWVKTFDEWNYVIDRWGLFNPPGVNYNDYDIDDDLPFNNPFNDEV